MATEEWRVIKNYPDYEITREGRIRDKSGYVISHWTDPDFVEVVVLFHDYRIGYTDSDNEDDGEVLSVEMLVKNAFTDIDWID